MRASRLGMRSRPFIHSFIHSSGRENSTREARAVATREWETVERARVTSSVVRVRRARGRERCSGRR